MNPSPVWFKWLISLNTALLIAGLGAGIKVAWINETRLALVENDVASLKSGRLIKMAEETRERFISLENQVHDAVDRVKELAAIVRENGDRLSRMEGQRNPAKRSSATELPSLPKLPLAVGGEPFSPGSGGGG